MKSLPYAFIFFLTVLVLATSAFASGVLSFNGPMNERERRLMDAYAADILKTPLSNLSIARADLNEDGLNEFLVRANCAGLCTYKILAESDDKIVELGNIEAKEIRMGNAYFSGVRNIIAYKNTLNDYDRTVYVWEPQASRYMIKE
jgi:hypothetical protein